MLALSKAGATGPHTRDRVYPRHVGVGELALRISFEHGLPHADTTHIMRPLKRGRLMVKRFAEYVTKSTLSNRSEAWLSMVRNSVPPRPGLTIDPRRCALLVIDMLHYFAHPSGRCYLPATEAIIPRIVSLLDAWRSFGGTVVFTRHCHEGEHDLGMLGRFFSDYIRAGKEESHIVHELTPRQDEDIIRKTTYDAFLGTELESILRRKATEQVLITGVLTHMCCETTARSAFCRGFEVYVAADAMASSNEERHVCSLLAMADSVAVVKSTSEILQRCVSTSI